MSFIPDWAPNIHPLIVHFPIAILTLAILSDLIAQFLRQRKWPQIAVAALYAAGAIAAVVAFLTGRAAADSVDVPAAANAVLTEHADRGELTMWFFLIYAGLRLALLRFVHRYGLKLTLPFFLVALIGGYFLWETADHGGEMVYAYGVGTRTTSTVAGDRDRGSAEPTVEDVGLVRTGGNSWRWIPTSAALSDVHWLTGSANDVQGVMVEGADGGSAIRIAASETPRIFTIGDAMESTQIDATVNLDSLDGSLALLHNVHGADSYGFFSVERGHGILGQVDDGKTTVLEQEAATVHGTARLRLVADKSHFRGYVNEKLVVHGHGDELSKGSVGIRFQGDGSFVIERIDVQSLR